MYWPRRILDSSLLYRCVLVYQQDASCLLLERLLLGTIAGQSISTAQNWGDVMRNMYPGYNETRPCMWHGSFDATLSPKDYDETLKQWTNVFGVPITPTKSQKDTPEKNYQTDNFGPDVQGI
jgi:hypothetical protein